MNFRFSEKWKEFLYLAESINIDAIVRTLEQLKAMTDTPGEGVTRLAYSDLDMRAKNSIMDLMQKAGLDIHVSAVGNILGRLSLGENDKPVVLTGSHSDTVKNGGGFDGVVGLICAIEAARVLNQIRDQLTYPVEVVDFAMEESTRFGATWGFGSYVLVGGKVNDNLLLRTDSEGITLANAIRNTAKLSNNSASFLSGTSDLDYALKCIEQSRRDPKEIKAYVELHVEQGQVLEESSIPIGVVTGAATPTRIEIEITGEQNHSGTTPMHKRKNALCAAAELVLLVDDLCNEEAQNETVGAVTKLVVEPNVMNVIPGHCTLAIDLRGTNEESKTRVLGAIEKQLDAIAEKRHLKFELRILSDEKPVAFSGNVVNAVTTSCDALKYPFLKIPSRAGHDAVHLAEICESGMIFIPSTGGISHNALEWTNSEDILKGTQVLLIALLQLAIQ